jgi:hypothetical protein
MDTVAILIPIAESVSPTTLQSICSVVGYSSHNGIHIKHIGVTERTLIDTARNNLARQFLKTDNEWSLWLDSDMTFPKETLEQLLKVAKKKKAKMVTGVYYQRGGKHFPVLWVRDPKLESGAKLVNAEQNKYDQNEYVGMYALPGMDAKKPFVADTAGFGCSLIHRSVFEVMNYPYFQFLPGKCSEDFYFFVNAKEKGFKLWADPTIDLRHIGTPPLIGREDCYDSLEEHKIYVEPIKEEK